MLDICNDILYHMIEASVTCINTYYARARARRHTCTRSDLADWTHSGRGPVDRSLHRANRNGSGTVPLRSHREVVGSYRNEWTQWNRCEHRQLERFWNRSGFKPVVWTRPYMHLSTLGLEPSTSFPWCPHLAFFSLCAPLSLSSHGCTTSVSRFLVIFLDVCTTLVVPLMS